MQRIAVIDSGIAFRLSMGMWKGDREGAKGKVLEEITRLNSRICKENLKKC